VFPVISQIWPIAANVEGKLPKLDVAGSIPVSRSIFATPHGV